jgi:hypothetical protein
MITYSRPAIYSSPPDITITTGPGGGLATVNFHTCPDKIDLNFSSTGTQMTYKDHFEPSGSSLGRLDWKGHGSLKQADLRAVDRAGASVCTVSATDHLKVGRIEIWRWDVEKHVFEQIVVSAVAELEDWRRKKEQQAFNPSLSTSFAAAAANNYYSN